MDGVLIIQLGDGDLPVATEHFPHEPDPLGAWSAHLAAQLRGDIILSPGHHLPFGYRHHDPHRRRWTRAALKRAIEGQTLERAALLVDPQGNHVAIRDADKNTVVTLESEDLEAIRAQPGRRLEDLHLPPQQLTTRLAKLWLSDLLHLGAELVVRPVSAAGGLQSQTTGPLPKIIVPMGAPVFPVARGHVRFCGTAGDAGQAILVEHGGGLFSRYGHLATLGVRPGQAVEADTLLGRVGMSGAAREPCLGFALERATGPDDGFTWHCPGATALSLDKTIGHLTAELPQITVALESTAETR